MRDLIGRTLGHYRIVDKMGEGGMGEVYRARDERLDRDVAVKVLPEEVAEDPQRLARFEREAKLLASLSHQNIATLHGLEEHEGRRFLVMEVIKGETLAGVIARGALSVDQAVLIAIQIAMALEAAHEHGVIHRDLKPANVMVDPDGCVKVLDFGLAKIRPGHAPEGSPSSAAPAQFPAPTETETGIILGTAAYMSPEQARGKPVDKRTDVWSFGVLLWEMLTGRPPFSGETAGDVIAAVLNTEPDLDVLPTHTPPAVRWLVNRCLRKDSHIRLPDIGAARIELQEVLAGSMDEVPAGDGEDAARAERRLRVRERRAWAVVALVLAGLATFLVLQRPTLPPQTQPVAHLVLDTPYDLGFGDLESPAVSPDGRWIAFAGRSANGSTGLWLRPLNAPASRALPGTEGAEQPFWSPDSASIAFWADEELRKVDIATGTIQRICAVPARLMGGTWSRRGTIVFSIWQRDSCLYSVPAAGGEAAPLTCPDGTSSPTSSHFWPQFLPDGRHLVFVGLDRGFGFGLYATTDEAPSDKRLVVTGLSRFLCATSGHLVFTRVGLLMAQPFDLERLVTTGEALPIASADDLVDRLDGMNVWGRFSISETGLVTWLSGHGNTVRLEWLDRHGRRLGTLGEPRLYAQIALSPDDRQVAVEVGDGFGEFDIWSIDVARAVTSRVTGDPGSERDPVWSPDGQELVFATNTTGSGAGGGSLVRRTLTAEASQTLVLDDPEHHIPECWSRDGGTLLYVTNTEGASTLSALSTQGDGSGESVMSSPFEIDETQISPDGRWLAFISNESGRFEVYLQPFRQHGQRVRVSANGGGQPKWRGDGKELFFLALDGSLMAVDVRGGAPLPEVGIPTTLIPAAVLRAVVMGPDFDDYAVTADGQRFLIKRSAATGEPSQIHVLLNWPSLIEKNEVKR